MKKSISFILVATGALIFSGCSSKQYFTPEQTYSPSKAVHSFGDTIVDLSRDGATLSNGSYIGKSGVGKIQLGEGYRFLSENENYILAGNPEGILKIIDKRSGEPVRAVALHVPIVAAKIDRGVIAYILNNNTFGLYQIADNRKVMENRSEHAYAIDTRAATPMFVDNLAVMPMLDGKLIIVDVNNPENAKVVYLSSEKYFNNVIYLARLGNMMVAATPKKVIVLGNGGKKEYAANISEVAVSKAGIYLFTKEGEVIRLDLNLKPIAKKKFKFAHFSTATALGDRVYALDQQGSLIVLSADLGKYKIYDVGAVDEPALMIGSRLYKDGKVIDLSKLSYE
jgi:hypothetical protein